jgi:hypothetical protein
MTLQQFQLDIAARLEAAAFFVDVPVLVYRARSAMTAAQIQDQINAALGALTAQNGKAGLCITIMMPQLSTREQELPGPYLHMACKVRVQENVMVNMGEGGTQIACEDAAIAVAQTLHLWTPGGTAGIIRVAENTIVPVEIVEGYVTYDVAMESDLDLACLAKTPQPLISASGELISIACANPAAAIYYTLDGTLPWSGNGLYPSSATNYTNPFSVTAGTMVRAAAYAAGEVGSDVTFIQL